MKGGRRGRQLSGAVIVGSIQSTGMPAWIKAYAAWLAVQVTWPKTIIRTKAATACATMLVTKKSLALLEKKQGFPELVEKYRHAELSRVRAIYENQLAGYLTDHKSGLAMAIAKGDYKAIPAFTTPAIERIWPKKVEAMIANPLITINVGGDVTRLLANLPAADSTDDVEDAEYTLLDRPDDVPG